MGYVYGRYVNPKMTPIYWTQLKIEFEVFLGKVKIVVQAGECSKRKIHFIFISTNYVFGKNNLFHLLAFIF